MPLKGKRILITGAGSGIGRALAIDASRRGAHVCICGRRKDKLDETMRLLPGSQHLQLTADVTINTDRIGIEELLLRRWNGVDILVNNAGLILSGPLELTDPAQIEALVVTNVIAPILLTRQLIPLLKEGTLPRIVNIGSMFGEIPFPRFATYSTSKAAMKGFSVALRRELRGIGIAVTYAAPRATDTDGAAVALDAAAGSKLDAPERVATQIWDAVDLDKDVVYPSASERLFLLIQSIAPRVIDRAVARPPRQSSISHEKQTRKEAVHVQN
ncbi:SDR family NAD(P)-dependent oxidoreductase [Rhizobium sp. P40RR-XXII]|nr:SDR family NAD(P)-dependent oxidoreductase [Rhizobium sp. P40RR-XXII]